VSEERDGLVIVYTGDGKGKTTAALGIVVRALGRRLPVAVVQFVKGQRKTGEGLFAEGLAGLDFRTLGEGFTNRGPSPEVHAAAARAGWEEARELVSAGRHRVVVLDELTYVLNYGWVELAEVLAVLAARPRATTVVVTGRNAPQGLVDAADLVTEMRCVKHPYMRGVPALPGVDL
jgi:cob(I)alamin adenosyltransferase